jgi:hypothetical protein
MPPRWFQLSDRDKQTYSVAFAFLAGRLAQRVTIEWAVNLRPDRIAERAAVLDLLDGRLQDQLQEPWRSAWQWIEEAWQTELDPNAEGSGEYEIRQHLSKGERSRRLIAKIVGLVEPHVEAKEFSRAYRSLRNASARKSLRRPRTAEGLIQIKLTSGKLIDPNVLGLDKVRESNFLLQLASELDVAVARGLDIGRRLGWDGERNFYSLGMLNRVCMAVTGPDFVHGHEPDKYFKGIAPSVKLLQRRGEARRVGAGVRKKVCKSVAIVRLCACAIMGCPSSRSALGIFRGGERVFTELH